MRISVASVGLNPLLPKNPATNLPARSFRGLSVCSSCLHSPLSHRERKVGSPVASIPLKSSISKLTAHVLSFPPSEKWPACLEAQEGDLSARLALPRCWHRAGWKGAALWGFLAWPAFPHPTGYGCIGLSLHPH